MRAAQLAVTLGRSVTEQSSIAEAPVGASKCFTQLRKVHKSEIPGKRNFMHHSCQHLIAARRVAMYCIAILSTVDANA